jgi:hypothetical protein
MEGVPSIETNWEHTKNLPTTGNRQFFGGLHNFRAHEK